MGYFVTRKTTFAALSPMQVFMEEPRDPFSAPLRWQKLPSGLAEAVATRERRLFDPAEQVRELVELS
jgi:hypothetical protein